MSKQVINESSTLTVLTRYYGTDQSPQTPQTLRWRLRDVSNDRVVRDWTDLTPNESVEITVIASDNNIYNDRSSRKHHFEERVLIVQANYETDTQYADEYRYLVKNLRGVDS